MSGKSWRSETSARLVLCLTLFMAFLMVLVMIRLVACSGMSRTGVGGVPGVGGGSILSVTPSAIGFGNETVGSTSASRSVTISNQGQLGLSVSQVSIVPSEFKLSGPTPPITIPPGSSVTYNVAFAPDAAQAFSGSVLVTSNASNGIGKASLSGTGVLQTTVLNVLPATISFGSELVNTTSSPQNALLTNGGVTAIAISGVQTSTPFAVAGFSGSATLNPAQSLTLSVTFTPTGQTSYAGFLTITGSAPSSPDTAALSGAGGAVCGQPNDGLIHIPPNWTTFTPPSRGGSYVDPVFGCTIVRLTDSTRDGVSEHHYYATLTPMSSDDSKVLIIDEHGAWHVTDLLGNVIVPTANMPAANQGTMLWDATNGNVFYFTSGNSLMKGTIGGNTVTSSVVHTFSEYQVVVLPDKTDLSIDGQSFGIWGGTTSGTDPLNIFTYNMQTNAKKAPYVTGCTQNAAFNQGSCVHGITQTADDNVIIGFGNDGACTECGNRLWNGSTLIHVQDNTSHIDTGYDMNGNPVIVERGNSFSLASLTNPCPSGWGLDIRNLNNFQSAVCLLDNQPSWHVGYRGSTSQPWVGISFFDTRTPGPEFFNNSPNFQTPSASNWQLYEDEIILARVDANNNNTLIYRLAHARSRTMESFWAQPRAAINRDGKYVIFDSNMAYAQTGCPSGIVNCSDLYLIKVQ